MDLQAYISTGILESYALGATTQHENAEVEAMLAKYPELVTEVNQIQEALENYAFLHEQTPPASLKEKTHTAIFGAENKTEKPNFILSANLIKLSES